MRTAYYETEVATAAPNENVRVLADRMEIYAVGCLVVVDPDGRPVGIVTDRDLACRVVARGLDPETTTAADVASKPLEVAESHEPIERIAARMREGALRRLPVVEGGRLVGLVAVDDLVLHLARELSDLGSAAKAEIDLARKRGRRERARRDLEENVAALEAGARALGRDGVAFVRREIDSLRTRLRGRDGED
jgi:CBS domain-containing protein